MACYGYCGISKKGGSISQQKREIEKKTKGAIIVVEKLDEKGRCYKEWDKLESRLKSSDMVFFFTVFSLGKTAETACEKYRRLLNKNIKIEFIKNYYLNSSLLDKNALDNSSVLPPLICNQICCLYGKSINISTSRNRQKYPVSCKKVETKKSISAKKKIVELSNSFNGKENNKEVIRKIGISRNSFYKYKRELFSSLIDNQAKQD